MEIRTIENDVIATGTTVLEMLQSLTSPTISGPQRQSFRRADLSLLNLQDAVIRASTAPGSNRRSDFTEASFSGSNLKNARFAGLDLRRADFSHCDLRGTLFVRCDLDEAILDGVALHRDGETYPMLLQCSMRRTRALEADFNGADIDVLSADGSIWRDCQFNSVNFGGNWDDAIMIGCDLQDARPGTKNQDADKVGCHFGILSTDCNTDGLVLEKCPSVPKPLPADFALDPEDVPDSPIEVERWEQEREALLAIEREKIDVIIAERAKLAADERNAQLQSQAVTRQSWEAAQAQITEDAKAFAALTREGHRIVLLNALASAPVLTGAFTSVPPFHGGDLFKVQVQFSEPLITGFAEVRDSGFNVIGGKIIGARRVDRRSDLWELSVKPSPDDSTSIEGTISLRAKGDRVLCEILEASVNV